MFIRQEKFGGEIPKVASNLIPSSAAKRAKNCRLTSGNLRAIRGNTFVWTPTKVGTIKTIYRYLSNFWFHWLTVVHLIKNPLAAETNDRVYWTGDGVPKITDSEIATSGGGTDYPNNSYSLFIPVPDTAPTLTAGTGDTCDISELSDRSYLVTFVRLMGGIVEEGAPGPLSNEESMCPDQQGLLSNLPQPPSGTSNITHIYIYRSLAGALHHVGTVAVGVTVYTDNKTAVETATQPTLPSLEWDPVPDDLSNLILLSNGVAAGISGKQVCLSVPYQLHAWPSINKYAFHDPPVAIGAFGNSVVVLLPEGKPQLLSGSDPSAMGQDYFELDQACESARSVATLGGMVIFAAPDGLCGVGPGVADILTKNILDRDEWRALNPSSIIGVVHDRRYYGFYDTGTGETGAFVFDPQNDLAPWQTLDLYATGAWSDPKTDTLFLVEDGDIVSFDTSAEEVPYLWESKDYLLPKPVNIACIKVYAVDYDNLFMSVIADGKSVHRQKIDDNEPLWLPDGYQSRRYGLILQGTSEVQSVVMAETITELEQV